jgi:hypothetical protein
MNWSPLHRDDFDAVRRLFDPQRYDLVIDSAFDGITPVRVYAAGREAALLWDLNEMLVLAGWIEDIDGLAALLKDRILPEARRGGLKELCLSYTPFTWLEQMDALLQETSHTRARRRFYTTVFPRTNWRKNLPSELELTQIDAARLADPGLANGAALRAEIRASWHSEAAFLEKGLGYALLDGEGWLSWCNSRYASGRHHQFSAATVEAARGRGYAALAAAACVDHCLAEDGTPHWNCRDDGSVESGEAIAIAQKVGFQRAMSYPVERLIISP